MTKLEQLAEIEGKEVIELLEEAVLVIYVCTGICINDGCDFTTENEPNQTQGYCEVLSKQEYSSVMSCFRRINMNIKPIKIKHNS